MRISRPVRRTVLLVGPLAILWASACATPSVSQRASAPKTALAPRSAPAKSEAVAAPRVDLLGPDEAALDTSVPPCEDFYGFACGGWMKATPIPADEASWVRSFSVIHEQNEVALRAILERDAAGDTRGDAYGAELGTLWASCMDEGTIEKLGAEGLAPELKAIAAISDGGSLVKVLGRLHRSGVDAVFNFDSEIDFEDATRMIAGVSQSGLGLPERDYYFRDDEGTKALRVAYVGHVAKTLELLGEESKSAAADADSVLAFEKELAGASMTNVELRDPQKIYHRLDKDGLDRIAPDLPWSMYLDALGFPGIAAINVAQPEFVKKANAMARSVKIADWKTYLRFHLARAASPFLSHKFVDEWFHFRQVLTGAKQLAPRWKRCVRFADQTLGEALAQPFVKDRLGEDGKRAAESMVAGIEGAMRADLEGLAWMDAPTRAKAESKLAKIVNKIGFPMRFRSYDGLRIEPGSFLRNMLSGVQFEVKRRLTKVGKPVDKEEWEMTPPTVNAYYEPTMNEMVFPAGILQAPFYSKRQAPPLNFGAIGMVVGHELSHGFDDEGRQFDEDGNLRDWWSPPVSAEFDRRAACVADQFDGYVAIDDAHIRGKLTLGENIADLGGLKLSYAAFERAKVPAATGRFSPEQQFFLGFAQSWCANYRPESLRLLVSTNPHSPPRFRVNGPLSNVPEFRAAFACKEGAPMVRPEGKRCEIW